MKHVYYFGCGAHVGHKWHGPQLRAISAIEHRALERKFNPHIDGRYAPHQVNQQLGAARVVHTAEWTILAWWDRSVDRRTGSNSALVVDGTHSFDAMMTALREQFPEVLARQLAPITLTETPAAVSA